MLDTDLDTLFGDVRAALDGPPTVERWRRLCALLEPTVASAELSERLLPYVESHLERWPDALRLAPPGWLVQRTLKANAHLLGLCRCVDITRGNLTHRGLSRLLGAWGERPITRLDLEDCRKISDAGCVAIAGSSHAATITHLNLNLCAIREAGVHALAGLTGPIEHLDLSYNAASYDALSPWIASGALAHARIVLINHCSLSSNDVFALCSSLCRGGLIERLELRGSTVTNADAFALSQLSWPDSLSRVDLEYLDASPRALELLGSIATPKRTVEL